MLKIGLFGLRGDDRGLAAQTQSFVKHLPLTRIYGIEMTEDGLSPYPSTWPNTSRLTVRRFSELDEDEIRQWLRGLDVVLGAETFYKDEFVTWAREEEVCTVLQINPEFVSWWNRDKKTPRPDIIVSPSTWRLNQMPGVRHLPFPIDREEFPFTLRTKAQTFVHVAGHGAAGDRAGSRIFLTLGRHRVPGKLICRTQSPLGFEIPQMDRITIQEDNVTGRRSLYADADVVVLPRRYGGLSLTAQEALSSGCPVVVLDRSPDNSWGGVVPVGTRVRGHLRTKAGLIQLYDTHPRNLAEKMTFLAGHSDKVEELSQAANKYADSISWDKLLPVYMDTLRETC